MRAITNDMHTLVYICTWKNLVRIAQSCILRAFDRAVANCIFLQSYANHEINIYVDWLSEPRNPRTVKRGTYAICKCVRIGNAYTDGLIGWQSGKMGLYI